MAYPGRLRRSESIAGRQPTVGITRSFVGRAGTVTGQHLPGLPAEDAHGISFIATLGQPLVGGRMP